MSNYMNLKGLSAFEFDIECKAEKSFSKLRYPYLSAIHVFLQMLFLSFFVC